MRYAASLAQIGHADAMAGGDEGVFDARKIASKRERPDLHAVEAEQAVDQYNRGAGRQVTWRLESGRCEDCVNGRRRGNDTRR